MIDIQHLVYGMNAQWSRERAATQLTLGNLIEVLEAMPPDAHVIGLCEPHSYRGYYTDLAFKQGTSGTTAAVLAKQCRACMGKVFQGYKGGDFVMGALTPLFLANYGECGQRIVAMNADGTITTSLEE